MHVREVNIAIKSESEPLFDNTYKTHNTISMQNIKHQQVAFLSCIFLFHSPTNTVVTGTILYTPSLSTCHQTPLGSRTG